MESANTTNTALAIASSTENVNLIISKTPEAYNKNQLSHDNCLTACQHLLDRINREGMNDELDKTAAKYIDKTRRTVTAMNELRSPVTKIFDMVRKEFTKLENDIDPAKAGTVPYQLQQLRNQYADRKRKEEEQRQRAEEAKRQADIARSQYRTALEEDYNGWFNNYLISHVNRLTELSSSVTLESYLAVCDTLNSLPTELSKDINPPTSVRLPFNITPGECAAIRDEVLASLFPGFRERFRIEVGDYRQEILDRLPSKKIELERAAKANAEEAARIKEDIARREAQEAARKEAERAAREKEEAKKVEVRKANTQAADLFDVARASAPAYQPKAKVTKKIRVITPEGYLQLMMMWWAKEGSALSKEELDKVFKKQIAFCEKLANKDGEFINDPSLEYYEDVKAQ